VEALVTGAEGSNKACAWDFSITLSVHPAVKGYLTLFRAGECEDAD